MPNFFKHMSSALDKAYRNPVMPPEEFIDIRMHCLKTTIPELAKLLGCSTRAVYLYESADRPVKGPVKVLMYYFENQSRVNDLLTVEEDD